MDYSTPPSPHALPRIESDDGFLSRVGGSHDTPPKLSAGAAAAAQRGDPLARRVLAAVCLCGMSLSNLGSTEYGQYMVTTLKGGPYNHGYAIAWINHAVLIIFLIPWAIIVMCEKGCSGRALWRAMVTPYGSTKRLVGVTFWLAFQYMLFNYGFWSWLHLASPSSAQTISQSQCIFVFVFSVIVLKEPFSGVRMLLVSCCVAGVCVLTYGDSDRFHHQPAHGSSSSDDNGSASSDSNPGSMMGDLLLIIPNAFNAFYAVRFFTVFHCTFPTIFATFFHHIFHHFVTFSIIFSSQVEWKRLVPGVQARDSLVGLGLLAAWHWVFWIWGMALLNLLHSHCVS